jgi:hypothetical protein
MSGVLESGITGPAMSVFRPPPAAVVVFTFHNGHIGTVLRRGSWSCSPCQWFQAHLICCSIFDTRGWFHYLFLTKCGAISWYHTTTLVVPFTPALVPVLLLSLKLPLASALQHLRGISEYGNPIASCARMSSKMLLDSNSWFRLGSRPHRVSKDHIQPILCHSPISVSPWYSPWLNRQKFPQMYTRSS